jgi:hypothetical protein
MLTRLIQRKQPVAADAIEYEYRDAEYEYENILSPLRPLRRSQRRRSGE